MKHTTMIMFCICLLIGCNKSTEQATPDTTQVKTILTGEETPIASIQVSPPKECFVVVGSIRVNGSYVGSYRRAQNTHIAFRVRELRGDKTYTGDTIYVYGSREFSQPLADVVIDTIQAGYSGKMVRLLLVIVRGTDPSMPYAEVMDWKFWDKTTQTWGPWALHEEEIGIFKKGMTFKP
jgi:hypothetical protein